MNNLKIIGTHHLMKEEEIRKEIDSYKPEIILIELCNGRITLINNPDQLPKERFSLLGLIAKSIRKKAKSENLVYGQDMISAYKIAKEKNIKIGLIDRPMVETKVLFGAIPLSEKFYLLKQLLKFNSKKIKVNDLMNEFDDEKVAQVIKETKGECPNFYYYIISSRDEYMSNKIKAILYDYPDKKILCFIGKGHLNSITKSLESLKGGQK